VIVRNHTWVLHTEVEPDANNSNLICPRQRTPGCHFDRKGEIFFRGCARILRPNAPAPLPAIRLQPARAASATYDNVRTRDLLRAPFFLQLPRIARPIANRLVNETKAGRGD
jgi:hypothetical protein